MKTRNCLELVMCGLLDGHRIADHEPANASTADAESSA